MPAPTMTVTVVKQTTVATTTVTAPPNRHLLQLVPANVEMSQQLQLSNAIRNLSTKSKSDTMLSQHTL